MPIKEKTRDEIEDCYKWDLSLIYKNNEEWYQEYREIESQAKLFSKYRGVILESPETLLKTLESFFWLERIFVKLRAYAIMKKDEDTRVPYYQKLKGEVDNLLVLILDKTSYVIPELLESDYSKIKKYIELLPELNKYKRSLKDIYRFKKYTLSTKEEELMSKFSKILEAPGNISMFLRNSDLVFDTIVDDKGNLVELTNNNYSKYIESVNREVRKEAFITLYKGYEKVKNTLATSLASYVEKNVITSQVRGFSSVLEWGLFDSNVKPELYHNLIKTVNKNLSVLHQYYQLKRKHLKLGELTLYDLHIPMVKEITKTYKFAEARSIVKESLKVLGDDYFTNLNKAFTENWIDVYSNKGKRSGAYSPLGYDIPPYVFMNYQGKFNDISTLIHELGHSMHSYYSNNNNYYQDAKPKIFTAEVASIVNELLLYQYMLKEATSKEEKLSALNSMLELFRNALFRQTMLAEFELEIYTRVTNHEVLTNELLSSIYYDLNKKYFGKEVFVNSEIKYEWARIPHFYEPFYVYQYATGISAACLIVENIINQKKGALESYLEFLKTGNRDYPVELLKKIGIDLSTPLPIEKGIEWFKKTMMEFQKLSRE